MVLICKGKYKMKNKKLIFVVISIIVLMILNVGCSVNMNSCTFQSEEEMSEVISGTWRTGDMEYDFILTIENDMANLGDDGAEDIVYVPDKGYFYYLYNDREGNEEKDQYYVVKENGEYVIKDDNWTFRKVD